VSGATAQPCVFCQRIASSEFDYSDDHSVAFQPLSPVTPGHFLVVPRTHVTHALEGPDHAGRALELAGYLANQMGLESANFITSAGAAATQTVMHLHVHIVPRREGDGLALPWTGQAAEPDYNSAMFTPAEARSILDAIAASPLLDELVAEATTAIRAGGLESVVEAARDSLRAARLGPPVDGNGLTAPPPATPGQAEKLAPVLWDAYRRAFAAETGTGAADWDDLTGARRSGMLAAAQAAIAAAELTWDADLKAERDKARAELRGVAAEIDASGITGEGSARSHWTPLLVKALAGERDAHKVRADHYEGLWRAEHGLPPEDNAAEAAVAVGDEPLPACARLGCGHPEVSHGRRRSDPVATLGCLHSHCGCAAYMLPQEAGNA